MEPYYKVGRPQCSTMVEYSSRLQAAMDLRSVKRTQLSKALGISYVAVKKVLDGQTKAFTAENNSIAASFLGVSPDWLATGEGDMIATDGVGTRSKFAENQSIELANAIEKVEAALVKIKTSTASNNMVHLEHAWPFKNLTRDQWLDLTDEQKAIVESVAAGMLTAHHGAGSGDQHDKRQAA